jgi:hypothetical protein
MGKRYDVQIWTRRRASVVCLDLVILAKQICDLVTLVCDWFTVLYLLRALLALYFHYLPL